MTELGQTGTKHKQDNLRICHEVDTFNHFFKASCRSLLRFIYILSRITLIWRVILDEWQYFVPNYLKQFWSRKNSSKCRVLKIPIMIQNLIRNRRNVDEVSLLFDIRWSPPPPDSYCEVKNCRNCNRKVIFDRISLYRTHFFRT